MKKIIFVLAAFLLIAGCQSRTPDNANSAANTDTSDGSATDLSPEEEAALEQALNNGDVLFDEQSEVNGEPVEETEEEEPVEESDPTEGLTEEEIAQAKDRDKQRLEHVSQLQKALEDYYKAKKSYPEKLEEIMPDFLEELPKDPETGEVYSYTPIGSLPAKHYDILYTLEIGDDDHPDGENVASPELKS